MSYYQFIFTLLISQAIVILFTIITSPNRKNISYICLSLFFVNLSVLAFACYLYLQFGLPGVMQIGGLHVFCFISMGPLLYIFLKIQLIPHFQFSKKDWIHALPFFIGVLGSIPLSTMSLEERIDIVHEIVPMNLMGLARVTRFVIYFIYTIACYRLLIRHRKGLQEVHSNSNALRMHWAQLLVGIFVSIWILNLAIILSRGSIVFITIGLEFLAFAFFIVAFFSLHYSKVFVPPVEDDLILATKHNDGKIPDYLIEEQDTDGGPISKYRTSPLTSEQTCQYKDKLVQLINDQPEVFYESDFQLSHLARLLGLPSYLASQVINEGMGKNFYELVNEQRIRRAQFVLESERSKERSILDIAYEVGFNSKSTFNQSFKKYVGTTPSAYRRSFSIN